MPTYSTCIFFELYKNKTDYYFQVFYRNTTTAANVPALIIPNAECGRKCSLEKWFEVYKDILPKEHETRESMCRL